MKFIMLCIYLAGMQLIAADQVQSNKSSTGIDGEKFYKKRCAVCHGDKAEKIPLKGTKPLAGMDAGVLARKTIAYRDQDSRRGAYAIYEHSVVMREATSSLSNQHISAIAKYISGLKK
jgi:cytochrome c553